MRRNELVIDCGGRLRASEANGSTYELQEKITSGVNCIDNGTIRLTYDAAEGTLDYKWFSPNDPVTARARATLTRQERMPSGAQRLTSNGPAAAGKPRPRNRGGCTYVVLFE